MYDINEINDIIKNSNSEVVEAILYSCIDKLNLIDVHNYCQKYGCKRDNIYKKIKVGKIPAIVIENKFFIVQNNRNFE